MSKNAIYICTLAQPWIEVITRLQNESALNPKYVLHWREDRVKFESSNLKKVYFQEVESAWIGEGFPEDLKPLSIDAKEYKEIAYYILIGIRMMDRLDPLGNAFSFRDREDFFLELIGQWKAIIENQEIDIIIAPTVPHRVFDYALYVASKMLGIDFVTFHLIPFGSNTILTDDLDNVILKEFDNQSEQHLGQEISEKIAKVRGTYEDGQPYYMKKHVSKNRFYLVTKVKEIFAKLGRIKQKNWQDLKYPNTYWVSKKGIPGHSRMSWWEYIQVSVIRSNRFAKNKKFYNRQINKPDSGPYVLVALHYQPEETSCPSAGYFGNQIQLIRFLDEVLPSNVSILIKEHRTQFFKTTEGVASRDKNYYRKLVKISQRIKILSTTDDPFPLIDGAVACATLTGTLGWESVVRGVPVMIFGRTWYGTLPQVYRIESKEDLREAWSKITTEDNRHKNVNLDSYHLKIQHNFVKAIHYKAFKKNTDVGESESIDNLTFAIQEYLDRQ